MSAIPAAVPGTLPGGARNGQPPFRPYVRHAPRPPWMHAALAAAEAEHGPPVPTCVCGQPIVLHCGYATCPACGHRTGGGEF